MSSRLEYEIMTCLTEANIKLNEQEQIFALRTMSITEAAELEALNEGFAETVRVYMNKVMQNTQNAWSKFKNTISKSVSNMLLSKWKLDDIKEALADNSVEGISIDNYSDYDLDKLGNFDVKELNYSTMKESLGSVSDFLKANYRDIYSDDKSNLKDGLRKYITRQKMDTHKLTKEQMQAIGDFVLNNYKTLQTKIEGNIKSLNTSADAVESLISVNKESSGVITLEDTIVMYFGETGDDEKMKISSDKSDDDDGEKKDNSNSELKKHIMNYMKATTQVLTAQMSIANEILMLYTRILVKYMNNWKSGKKDGGSEENKSGDNSKIQKIQ